MSKPSNYAMCFSDAYVFSLKSSRTSNVKPFPFQTQFDFEYIPPLPSKSPGAKFYAEWIKEMIGVGWGLRIWKEEEEKRVWVGGGE